MGNRCCKKAESGPPQDANPFKPNNRKCTDVLCLLFFLVFWVGMIVVAAVGYTNGQPQRLIYGTDWMGRTCGTQADATDSVPAYDLSDYKYLIYPRLSEDVAALVASGEDLTSASSLRKFFGVCVSACPMLNDSATGSALYVHAYKDYGTHGSPVNELDTSAGSSVENEAAGSPWRLMTDSTEVLYRCVELSKIDVEASARCVDDCEDDEVAAYEAGTVDSLTCGTNETRNPFMDCGDESCVDVVLAKRANCTSVETMREERQVGGTTEDPVADMLSRKWAMVARWLGDVEKAAVPILLCGGLFALLLGFFWLVLLRYCAGLFVWLVLVLVMIMQLAVTLFCAYEGDLISNASLQSSMTSLGVSTSAAESVVTATTTYVNSAGISVAEDQVRYWAIACYVFTAMDVLLLLLLIFMCSRIRIAIGIIRETSKALAAMPTLTLFPVLPTLLAIGLVAYWIVAGAYIATSADVTLQDVASTATSVASVEVTAEVGDNDAMHYLMLYHLFGLLWTMQFIQAAAYAAIAGAFCEYYWTLDKRQLPVAPLLRSMWRTMRFHLGSIAFGSLIIAVVQMVRLALEYIDHKMRTTKQGNTVVKVVMACLKCCLWCFEKCLKFLNKNAFIVIAMKGQSFCPAMKASFSLLLNNAARVATVSVIARFLMIMGKLFIAGFSTLFMFLFIRYPPSQLPSFFMGDLASVSSPIFPMLLTTLLAYTTASFFLDVYGTGIDTILLCFCEDCDVNKSSGQYYMSDELLAFIDGPAKKNAFRAYQPARDVSAWDSTAATAPPIFQDNPAGAPMTKTG